jgi:hypothetical protein
MGIYIYVYVCNCIGICIYTYIYIYKRLYPLNPDPLNPFIQSSRTREFITVSAKTEQDVQNGVAVLRKVILYIREQCADISSNRKGVYVYIHIYESYYIVNEHIRIHIFIHVYTFDTPSPYP